MLTTKTFYAIKPNRPPPTHLLVVYIYSHTNNFNTPPSIKRNAPLLTTHAKKSLNLESYLYLNTFNIILYVLTDQRHVTLDTYSQPQSLYM